MASHRQSATVTPWLPSARRTSGVSIALSMDRANFTNQIGWTYGALYLYHGHPKKGERAHYEYRSAAAER